jgi:hypothetical protein
MVHDGSFQFTDALGNNYGTTAMAAVTAVQFEVCIKSSEARAPCRVASLNQPPTCQHWNWDLNEPLSLDSHSRLYIHIYIYIYIFKA